MTRQNLNAIVLLILLLLGALRAVDAAESYDNCTGFINSLPATISTQGTWCLNQDLTTAITSGNAITIATNNVTLDCNDFKLGGLPAGLSTLAIGIRAIDRLNATVRHCNIRGFFTGLYFTGSSSGGHAVEDNRFDGNTSTGIYVGGSGSVLRRNRVFDTGGSTLGNLAFGITTELSVDILDNTVSGVAATSGGGGYVIGITTASNPDSSVSGNRVRGLLPDGAGTAFGIYNFNVGRLTLRNNNVVGNATVGSIGLRCFDADGRAKDNVINGFVTGLSGCSNDGNVIAP